MLKYRAKRLSFFAGLCRGDTSNFYITHGDAGGNFLVNNGKYYIVDWDDAFLAPPERDAWVMGYCDWARRLFEQSLLRNGIDYSLRPERLAYYGYHMFFYWLTWLTKCAQFEEIKDFFETYGAERIEYADKLYH
jgi:thiamine kinase-like enzyme